MEVANIEMEEGVRWGIVEVAMAVLTVALSIGGSVTAMYVKDAILQERLLHLTEVVDEHEVVLHDRGKSMKEGENRLHTIDVQLTTLQSNTQSLIISNEKYSETLVNLDGTLGELNNVLLKLGVEFGYLKRDVADLRVDLEREVEKGHTDGSRR